MTGTKEDRESEGKMIGSSMAGSFGSLSATLGYDETLGLFNKSRAAGRSHKILSLLTRRSNRLLDLNSYPTERRYGHYAGQREVPLDKIRGTEGRLNDFDDRFHPLTDRTRQRWLSVATANEQGMDLPPVELIQIEEVYFVRDGHHRISVARAFGQTMITARVTIWEGRE